MSKVFNGLDYQGRYPRAAEAATDIGADDENGPEGGAIAVLLAFTVVLLAIIAAINLVAA